MFNGKMIFYRIHTSRSCTFIPLSSLPAFLQRCYFICIVCNVCSACKSNDVNDVMMTAVGALLHTQNNVTREISQKKLLPNLRINHHLAPFIKCSFINANRIRFVLFFTLFFSLAQNKSFRKMAADDDYDMSWVCEFVCAWVCVCVLSSRFRWIRFMCGCICEHVVIYLFIWLISASVVYSRCTNNEWIVWKQFLLEWMFLNLIFLS